MRFRWDPKGGVFMMALVPLQEETWKFILSLLLLTQ